MYYYLILCWMRLVVGMIGMTKEMNNYEKIITFLPVGDIAASYRMQT